MRSLILIVFLSVLTSGSSHLPNGIYTKCYDPGTISLTFDDGMSERSLQIAAILEEKQIKATFFVIGNTLVKNTNFLSLKQIYERGHQIASHSWTHPYLTKLSDKRFEYEILETQNGLGLIDHDWKRYIRPPFGAINQTIYDKLTKFGYFVVLWNIDLRDWNIHRTESQILTSYNKIMDKANPSKDSFILILHERQRTVTVLPKIIDIGKAKGFRFITVDNCITLNH